MTWEKPGPLWTSEGPDRLFLLSRTVKGGVGTLGFTVYAESGQLGVVWPVEKWTEQGGLGVHLKLSYLLRLLLSVFPP